MTAHVPSAACLPCRRSRVYVRAVAGVGFVTQLLCGFTLGAPLNLIFLPLTLVEWLLRWQITWSGPIADPAVAASG